jgi:hypothetical protein
MKGAVQAGSFDEYLITFCDNVYHECIFIATPPNCASVRDIESDQLDGWREDKWRYRKGIFPCEQKLAGWCLLNESAVNKCDTDFSLVEFLNVVKAIPVLLPRNDWWDIGTPESYIEYLKGPVQ